MAEVTITWHGDAILADIAAAVEYGMNLAGKTLAASTQRRVSEPYPPASRPGSPPHRRSGGLHGAVGHRITRSGHNVTLDVGVPDSSPVARQASGLQKGTRRMAARPFLPEDGPATTTVVGFVEGAVRARMGRS